MDTILPNDTFCLQREIDIQAACVEHKHKITHDATRYTRTGSFFFHHPLPPRPSLTPTIAVATKIMPSRHSAAPLAQPSQQVNVPEHPSPPQ
jgi:hypothetical protein